MARHFAEYSSVEQSVCVSVCVHKNVESVALVNSAENHKVVSYSPLVISKRERVSITQPSSALLVCKVSQLIAKKRKYVCVVS